MSNVIKGCVHKHLVKNPIYLSPIKHLIVRGIRLTVSLGPCAQI